MGYCYLIYRNLSHTISVVLPQVLRLAMVKSLYPPAKNIKMDGMYFFGMNRHHKEWYSIGIDP
jgi:hypothetical protein